MSTFEISETPTIENPTSLLKDAMDIKAPTVPAITGKTGVLKIMIDGAPFYHFNNRDFDSELATRKQDVVVNGKRFYMGLKNTSRHTRMKLRSAV